MMNQDDIFEVIKGNVKSVNLSKIIAEKEQALIEWIMPYYIDKDLVRLHNRQTMYNDCCDIYKQPEWPKGKVRSLTHQYSRKMGQIKELKSIQHMILSLAFSEYCRHSGHGDYESTYEVENIIVKRTAAE